MHEEHRARPGWGDDVTLEFLRALQVGRAAPAPATSTTASSRPKGPEQVAISYYQASLVVEWIEAQRGFPAILELLKAYGEGRSTEQAFEKVLGTSLEDFDKGFFAHLQQRFAGPLAAIRPPAKAVLEIPERSVTSAVLRERADGDPGQFEAQIAAGLALFHESKRAEALPYLERAEALFPEYAGKDSPHFYLAAIYKDQGKTAGGDRPAPEAHRHLREPLPRAARAGAPARGAGRPRRRRRVAGSRALHLAVRGRPFTSGWPASTRAWATGRRSSAPAARWSPSIPPTGRRRSTSSPWPCSRPETTKAARREVLRALEIAPRFQRAQELLLRLHDARAGSASQ